MSEGLYLGIDTSNYKTSIAVAGSYGEPVFERSELLEVAAGKRGLRQSEAFYQHSMRLPIYIDETLDAVSASHITAVGVSERPRRQEGSYMPCFNAGINASRILASALGCPVYGFSHQEGHAAAIMPADETDDCIFMHLSGGTTEFLLCRPDEHGYDMTIIGGTKDISFGQLLDRFGVAMGMPFPAGGYLDKLCDTERILQNAGVSKGSSAVLPKIRIEDGYFNLSGAETRLMRFAETPEAKDGSLVSEVCAEIFAAIADILIRSAEELKSRYGAEKVYLAGGVASSGSVRRIISGQGRHDIIFGDPVYSGDNAVGIAKLTARMHNQ